MRYKVLFKAMRLVSKTNQKLLILGILHNTWAWLQDNPVSHSVCLDHKLVRNEIRQFAWVFTATPGFHDDVKIATLKVDNLCNILKDLHVCKNLEIPQHFQHSTGSHPKRANQTAPDTILSKETVTRSIIIEKHKI